MADDTFYMKQALLEAETRLFGAMSFPELRRLSFEHDIADDTNGRFHVLVLVEGDEVLICSKSDPTHCYHQKHMDMVVVPASMGEYEIINLGKTPCRITKTMLK